MFGIFNRGSRKNYEIVDKVWLSKQAKWNACSDMLKLNSDCVFIAWFEETRDELKAKLGEQAPVFLANQLGSISVPGKLLVFIEHHPLMKEEEKLFETLNLNEIPVLSALDEPIFKRFGGENLISLIKNLGMSEGEILGHSLITKSIKRAQQKLAEKIIGSEQAYSQEEWFARNYKG
ncbi:MAG: hypothetical protein MUC73_10115 [Cyclobacteriaceae bacterium]|nr:hypothetical protein [Cyclobacteriaceae bacterium]